MGGKITLKMVTMQKPRIGKDDHSIATVVKKSKPIGLKKLGSQTEFLKRLNFPMKRLSELVLSCDSVLAWKHSQIKKQDKFTTCLGVGHASFGTQVVQLTLYRKDIEPLYHTFMYSLIILLSSIYPFRQCLSLLVTIICYPYI